MRRSSAGTDSLYHRLGGHEPLAAIVDVLSRRIVIDGELAHYFAHFDLEELRRQQVAFLEVAFGGPYPYERATLLQAHWSLRISGREFGLVIDHFAAALRACSVSEMLAAEVLERIATLRDEVVDADR